LDQLKGSVSSGLQGIKQHWQSMDAPSKQVLMSGLVGTGLGAATGLGSSMLAGDGQTGRRMLRGGIAGAALGGGLGLAMNPEVATKLQKQLSGPSKQTATKAPASKLGPDASALMSNPDPSARLKEINRLQGMADSSNPELAAGGQLAATAGVAGEGLRRLNNIESYDPAKLSKELYSRLQTASQSKGSKPGSTGSGIDALSEDIIESFSNGNKAKANAVRSIFQSPVDIQDVQGSTLAGIPITTKNIVPTAEELLKHAPKGSVTGAIPPQLSSAVRGNADDIVSKGFRDAAGRIRWPRSLAGLGLVGAGGALTANIIRSYLQNAEARRAARNTLRQISNSVAPQQ